MRLGTYTTFDCPTQQEDEALVFLKAEFDKIGGRVRRVMNPHDFGEYPSFEIDYPDEIEMIKDDEDLLNEELVEDTNEDKIEIENRLHRLDEWHENANEIYQKYFKKFEKYL
jgi:hypothetical protein